MNPLKTLTIIALLTTGSAWANEPANKEKVLAHGKAKFVLCGACHGNTGNGEPTPGLVMAPSLLTSKLVKADPETHALILLKGIKKENYDEYMGQVMAPLGANMTNEDLAAIITYTRTQFAKATEITTPEQVKAWREKHKTTPQPTRAQLEKRAKTTTPSGGN